MCRAFALVAAAADIVQSRGFCGTEVRWQPKTRAANDRSCA
jgi:hypothetical protein